MIKKPYLLLINAWAWVMKHILTEKIMMRIMLRYCYYYARKGKKIQDAVIWGNTPVVNIKYFSLALKKGGYKSYTLVPDFLSSINKKRDFDLYFDDVIPGRVKKSWFWSVLFWYQINYPEVKKFWALLHIMKYARIYHCYFDGGPIAKTEYWKHEPKLLRLAGVKTIGSAFGSDIYMYSRIRDLSIRHVLNSFYPYFATGEREITERVEYWHENFDVVVGSFVTDGRGRWDLLLSNTVCMDTDTWQPKTDYSLNDGKNGPVKIMHLSNHKPYTGTDFIVNAINELKEEGLKIDFYYPSERIQNDEVKEKLNEIDIYVDGIIFTGYGMASVEVMATGNCSIVNLENKELMQVFRRYSWLNECPMLSATPETVKEQIKLLVTHPELRKILGKAGRKYVEKYHSEKNLQYWFGCVYDKIINNKNVDLSNLYNPVLKDSYNNKYPKIEHPLINNKLPKEYTHNSAFA